DVPPASTRSATVSCVSSNSGWARGFKASTTLRTGNSRLSAMYLANLALSRPGKVYLGRELRICRQKLLHDFPGQVEDLHETAVVWQGANDQVLPIIHAHPVGNALPSGDYADPQATYALKRALVNLNRCSYPAVCIGGAKE